MQIIEVEDFEIIVRLFKVLKEKEGKAFTVDAMMETIRLHFPRYKEVNIKALANDTKAAMDKVE